MEGPDAKRAAGQERRGVRGLWRPLALIALILAIWLAAGVSGVGEKLAALRDWVKGLGPLAPLVFVAIRAGAAVAVIPGSALSAAAAVLFDPVTAVACVSAGKTIGAGVSFLIARYFAREPVARWLATKPKYGRFDELVAEHGALVVALARLVPVISFNVQNYAFGLTRVRFGTYLFWSWLCMLPGAVLVVSGIGVITRTLASGKVPWVLVGVLAASVLIMAALAGYTAWRLYAKRRRS
jgi:uncharacterized membrane protein YdjX (TVP38/TMEM64 family)